MSVNGSLNNGQPAQKPEDGWQSAQKPEDGWQSAQKTAIKPNNGSPNNHQPAQKPEDGDRCRRRRLHRHNARQRFTKQRSPAQDPATDVKGKGKAEGETVEESMNDENTFPSAVALANVHNTC
jgi:hypothetical protein